MDKAVVEDFGEEQVAGRGNEGIYRVEPDGKGH